MRRFCNKAAAALVCSLLFSTNIYAMADAIKVSVCDVIDAARQTSAKTRNEKLSFIRIWNYDTAHRGIAGGWSATRTQNKKLQGSELPVIRQQLASWPLRFPLRRDHGAAFQRPL